MCIYWISNSLKPLSIDFVTCATRNHIPLYCADFLSLFHFTTFMSWNVIFLLSNDMSSLYNWKIVAILYSTVFYLWFDYCYNVIFQKWHYVTATTCKCYSIILFRISFYQWMKKNNEWKSLLLIFSLEPNNKVEQSMKYFLI